VAVFDQDCGAVFSTDRQYRYALWRNWDKRGKRVLFVGLNPSTADENTDDPTIRRCVGFARDWGYGGVLMGNLFAFRATRPRDLRLSQDPVGRRNDRWLEALSRNAGMILACWGNHGLFMNRQEIFRGRYPDIHCLAINRTGTPAHPLYQPKTRQARKYL
jgi:hypothetical protein